MTHQIIMLVVGIVIGAVAGIVPLLLIARLRSKTEHDRAAAGVRGEMAGLQERVAGAEAECIRLRNETRELQEKHTDAAQRASGAESRAETFERQIQEQRSALAERDRRIDELTARHGQKANTIAELETRLAAERRQAEEKLALLTEAKEKLSTEFQNLANRIFDEKTTKFSEQSRTNLDLILKPLSEQLGQFRTRIDEVYTDESKDRQSLRDQIASLTALNQQVNIEARNLTNALKGESKTRGNWGEMILERVLELSGLRNGTEYETQVSGVTEDGKRQLPDVVVHLPEERDVVVDSKVSLIDYEASVNAPTEEERRTALEDHCAAVRIHIDSLSSKAYENHARVKSLDFVLMFMPVEAAFVAAITHDPELFGYAYGKRVILVCPSTLLVTLRTIQNMWRVEYNNRNAQTIARKAADLYDKFAGFVDVLEDVRKSIGSAGEKCDDAMKRLSRGNGNLVRRVEEFRTKLQVKPKKNLPAGLLEDSGATDDNDSQIEEPPYR